MTLASIVRDDLKCATCKDAQKKVRGCESKPRHPFILLGEELDRCPMRPFFENPEFYNTVFERYKWMEKGFLVDPGTILDQSRVLLTCFKEVTRAQDDVDRADKRKREAEQNAANRKARMAGSSRGKSKGRRR